MKNLVAHAASDWCEDADDGTGNQGALLLS